nr:transmembrane protein FAM155B isoform X3 [Anas platyrhynchos]
MSCGFSLRPAWVLGAAQALIFGMGRVHPDQALGWGLPAGVRHIGMGQCRSTRASPTPPSPNSASRPCWAHPQATRVPLLRVAGPRLLPARRPRPILAAPSHAYLHAVPSRPAALCPLSNPAKNASPKAGQKAAPGIYSRPSCPAGSAWERGRFALGSVRTRSFSGQGLSAARVVQPVAQWGPVLARFHKQRPQCAFCLRSIHFVLQQRLQAAHQDWGRVVPDTVQSVGCRCQKKIAGQRGQSQDVGGLNTPPTSRRLRRGLAFVLGGLAGRALPALTIPAGRRDAAPPRWHFIVKPAFGGNLGALKRPGGIKPLRQPAGVCPSRVAVGTRPDTGGSGVIVAKLNWANWELWWEGRGPGSLLSRPGWFLGLLSLCPAGHRVCPAGSRCSCMARALSPKPRAVRPAAFPGETSHISPLPG